MNPTQSVNLALAILNGALQLIGELKAQHGLTDDQILAQGQEITAGNDQLYAQLKAALTTGS